MSHYIKKDNRRTRKISITPNPNTVFNNTNFEGNGNEISINTQKSFKNIVRRMQTKSPLNGGMSNEESGSNDLPSAVFHPNHSIHAHHV